MSLSTLTPLRWVNQSVWTSSEGHPAGADFHDLLGLPALLQGNGITFSLNRLTAAVLALSLNSAAYLAEIVRAVSVY